MVSKELGHIHGNLYKLGIEEIPIFLLDAPQPAIFDAGVSCIGKVYAEAIRSVLRGRQPALLFLSHVHWDHCGSVPYLKEAFPAMKVAASSLGAEILRRPNAVDLIKTLNENTTARIGTMPGVDPSLLVLEPFASFEVDIELKDGQSFDLGEGNVLEVMATPGHTQDHCSFYLPDSRILIAGEAGGVYYGPDTVSTEFVSDYDAYLTSLEKLAALPAEVFCQGHYAHLTGREEISAFFERSVKVTVDFKRRVLELLNEENGAVDKVAPRIKKEYFDPIPEPKQPEVAYLLNLQAQIRHLAAKRSEHASI